MSTKLKVNFNIKNTNTLKIMLKTCMYPGEDIVEAGIDEAGRGPLFGRVYTAVVVLPKYNENPDSNVNTRFDFSLMKDSKRFTSKKKIKAVSDYIKENAVDYAITYRNHGEIDKRNILQATVDAMHEGISAIKRKPDHILVDGNYFRPYTYFNATKQTIQCIPHTCIPKGDNSYASIAAASILAKVARDEYIESLCDTYPDLDEKYDLRKNKGYGTKNHRTGISTHGTSKYHRVSFTDHLI